MYLITKTQTLSTLQFEAINMLWNQEYPVNLKDRFPLLLADVDTFAHYLIEENNSVLAWAVYFEKEGEIRFSIIVDEVHQGKGLGTALIHQLKKDLGIFFGWVIDHSNDTKANGAVYISPLPFYIQHGFEVLTDQRIDSELLKAVKIKRSI